MRQQCIRISVAMAAVLAMTLASAAHAIELSAGDWKFTVTGNVNGDYVFSDCDSNPRLVVGGLACTALTGSSAVSNGLLPAAILFSGSTNQAGYDVGFTFGFYPGIATNDGGSPNLQGNPAPLNTALGTTGLDIRQVFLTFGNETMGKFLVGRNIGLFGGDAILNDMTLLGVGGVGSDLAAPANTTLGSIGLGYIYTDWLAQIDYTTPDMGGAKFTLGIFDPLETLNSFQPTPVGKSIPGAHAKLAFTSGPVYLSGSFLFQKQRGIEVNAVTNPLGYGFTSWAADLGGKVDMGPFEVLGWYYLGTGVGTTGLFDFASAANGKPRNSQGFLAQITYTVGPTKLGVNYGQSRLIRADGEINNALVAKNAKWTAGVYYNLTPALTLLTEATYVESLNQTGLGNHSKNFNAGAFLKF
jgi:predicted porin